MTFKTSDKGLSSIIFRLDFMRDESEVVKQKVTFEDKMLSAPLNFYGMYLSITDEDKDQVMKEKSLQILR